MEIICRAYLSVMLHVLYEVVQVVRANPPMDDYQLRIIDRCLKVTNAVAILEKALDGKEN